MNVADLSSGQTDFLKRFFGPGNRLRWDAYCDGSMSEGAQKLLAPFLEDFVRPDTPVLLPRVSEAAKDMTIWYGLARDPRQARGLKEQLTAFVGPTYSDFNGQQADLDDGDPIEAAVKQHFAPYVFRLGVLNRDDRTTVSGQLELLRQLRSHMAARSPQIARPIGRILRDLEMALVVRNELTANQILDELRSRGRLSALNLAFLQVRVLAEFERWPELQALSVYRSLLDSPRPARVTEALTRCIYASQFAPFEVAGDVTGAVLRFRQDEPRMGTLFHSRGALGSPDLLKAWMLRAVARGDRKQAIGLRDLMPAGYVAIAWADALIASLGPAHTASDSEVPASDPALRAREAFEVGDYDRAFELLLDCPTTIAVLQRLIECALEIGSLDAARRAIEVVQSVSSDVRETALQRRTVLLSWERLTLVVPADAASTQPASIPTDWGAWFKQLDDSDPWAGAVEVARRGAVEWPTDRLRSQPEEVALLADRFAVTRSPASAELVRTIVPDLIRSFLPADGPVREFKPIYIGLLFLLSLDDGIGVDDLTALGQVVDAILQIGPTASSRTNEYQDVLDCLDAAWGRVQSGRHLDWALGALDLLIAYNVGQHVSIDPFLHRVVDGFRSWSRRIREDQWLLIDCLADDLGQRELLNGLRPTPAGADESRSRLTDALRGKSVAIYTLTEQIGRRAARFLETAFEGVRVHLLHDKGSSDRLKQLCESADLFVVNTWDAKHAATGAIRSHRPQSATSLFPKSKTAISILQAVVSYVTAQMDGPP